MTLISDVLPAPFGQIRPTYSPASIEKDTSFRIFLSPKDNDILSAVTSVDIQGR